MKNLKSALTLFSAVAVIGLCLGASPVLAQDKAAKHGKTPAQSTGATTAKPAKVTKAKAAKKVAKKATAKPLAAKASAAKVAPAKK